MAEKRATVFQRMAIAKPADEPSGTRRSKPQGVDTSRGELACPRTDEPPSSPTEVLQFGDELLLQFGDGLLLTNSPCPEAKAR
jgi:hypothetical protein